MSAKDVSKCPSGPVVAGVAKYIFISGLIVAIGYFGDRLLTLKRTPWNSYLIAVSDTLIHGVIGLFSWLLICAIKEQPICEYMVLSEAFLCGLTASAIDLDHVIAARSFDIKVIVCQTLTTDDRRSPDRTLLT